jgi:undecaprenyl pyrophosphate synthase
MHDALARELPVRSLPRAPHGMRRCAFFRRSRAARRALTWHHCGAQALRAAGVRLLLVGDPAPLPAPLRAALAAAVAATSSNEGLRLTVALNYSGRYGAP